MAPTVFLKNISNLNHLFLGLHLMIPSHIGSMLPFQSCIGEGMGLVSYFFNFLLVQKCMCWQQSIAASTV